MNLVKVWLKTGGPKKAVIRFRPGKRGAAVDDRYDDIANFAETFASSSSSFLLLRRRNVRLSADEIGQKNCKIKGGGGGGRADASQRPPIPQTSQKSKLMGQLYSNG